MTTMNISFRTLKGDKFKLDATPDETVADLKKKVVARYEDTDADAYRLIYKGKILDGSKTLADCGVTESGFIVVMPPKRTTPAPAEAKPAEKSTTTPAKPSAAPAAPAPAPVPAPAPAPTAGASSSSLVTGAEYDATLKRICEMGFPEAEVKRALRAAFNNPDRAVDYLFNGIPASAAPPPAPPSTPPQGAPTGAAAAGGGGAPAPARPGQPFNMFGGGAGGQGGAGGGAAARGGNLDFLRRQQGFNEMRRLIQSNPAVVHQILSQLEQTDPALLQLINNNREEFLNLINQPVDGDGGPVDDNAMEQLANALAASGGGGGMAPPGQIIVTEEENQVIQRLTELGNSMGLEQVHVVQAWLACDKDENLAANYLLNHSDELRAQQAEDAALEAEANRNNNQGGDGQQPPPQGGN